MVGSTGTGVPTLELFKEERLPRILLASLIGAALAASGAVYQAILRNPLADPYLLGVSSGASLFAYIWRFPQITGWLFVGAAGSAISQQVFALTGSLFAIALVLSIAGRRGR